MSVERGWRAARAGAALVAVLLTVSAGWAAGPLSALRANGPRLLNAQTPPDPDKPVTPAKQPVIAAIDVQPARYEGLVLDAMRCKVGEPFDDAKLQADVDTIFALGTGTSGKPGNVMLLGVMAAEAMAIAVQRAILSARALEGYPAAVDFVA